MLTRQAVKIAEYRIRLMRYSICTPLTWKNNRVVFTPSPVQRLAVFSIILYILVHGISTLRFVVNSLLTDFEGENFDALQKGSKTEQAALITLTHLMFIAMTAFMLGVFIALSRNGEWIVAYFNTLMETDRQYQRTFRNDLALQHEQLKYGNWLTELITLGGCLGTLVVPLVFGFIVFQPVNPLHRMIVNNFGVRPRLQPRFIPLILFLDYMVLQGADVFCFFLLIGLFYLRSIAFWQTNLCPTQLLERDGEGQLSFRCRLGSILSQNVLLRMYQHHQLLTVGFNQICANWQITLHHGSSSILAVVGMYIFIRNYAAVLFIPGFQLAPMSVGIVVAGEYFESVFIESVNTNSTQFLDTMKALTRMNMSRRDRQLQYSLKSYWPLKAHTAYPYYSMSRQNFAAFIDTSIDRLVTILCAF